MNYVPVNNFMDSIVIEEIRVQREAMEEIIHQTKTPEVELYVIKTLSVLFRTIICEFESTYERPPTKDELIWVCSEKMQRDIRKLLDS
jgi:hypothetical protein